MATANTTSTSLSSTDALKPTRRTAPTTSSLSSPTTSQTTTTPITSSTPIPPAILAKLLLFTLAMVVAPISTYFLLKEVVLVGVKSGATWAGAGAAVVANAVLVGYILVAFWEDQGDEVAGGKKVE